MKKLIAILYLAMLAPILAGCQLDQMQTQHQLVRVGEKDCYVTMAGDTIICKTVKL